MLCAIYAYESLYDGLHGMDSSIIVYCNSVEEAEEIATEISLRIMESYSCIMDDFYENASEDYEEGTDEWYEAIEEMKQENVAYNIYTVSHTKGKSIRELEHEFRNHRDRFIETYCI